MGIPVSSKEHGANTSGAGEVSADLNGANSPSALLGNEDPPPFGLCHGADAGMDDYLEEQWPGSHSGVYGSHGEPNGDALSFGNDWALQGVDIAFFESLFPSEHDTAWVDDLTYE
jgi:hypothetical protein